MAGMNNIPVLGEWFGKSYKLGTADFVDDGVKIALEGDMINTLQKLVEDGGEIYAFHINVEMLAARKQELLLTPAEWMDKLRRVWNYNDPENRQHEKMTVEFFLDYVGHHGYEVQVPSEAWKGKKV